MGQNNWQKRNDADLAQAAHQAYTTISANLLAYGASNTLATALDTAVTGFDGSITNATAARAASLAATQAKAADKATVVDALNAIGAVIYNNPTVSPEMLVAAGYAVHDTSGTKVVPQEPTGLLATPYANSTVELEWNRNGNPGSVTFLIETSTDNLNWTILLTTTKARLTVSGFTPGAQAWFRVSATANGIVSLPSNTAVIYPSGGQQLKVA